MTLFPKLSLWERWADFTIRHDRWILGAVLAVTVFFTYFLFRIEVSTSPKDFFRKESEEIRRALLRNFQQGDYVIVIFEAQSKKGSGKTINQIRGQGFTGCCPNPLILL